MRKKIDNRIRELMIECLGKRERSLFVLVGERSRDQVVFIHQLLTKVRVGKVPTVLWCFKSELGFSTHRKKRLREMNKRRKMGNVDADSESAFDLFVSGTQIRWCYYSESERILGQQFDMCVLQDFEALTPNLLCRTIETVAGGGVVLLLLHTVAELRQLATLTMDVHARYRTEAHRVVVPRFNERFLLSLSHCESCIVLDDCLDVVSTCASFKHTSNASSVSNADAEFDLDSANVGVEANSSVSASRRELEALKGQLAETPIAGRVVQLCETLDQARTVMRVLECASERRSQSAWSTCCVSAGRGRGKSAALGLTLGAAIAFGYSNVFVTAPSVENVRVLFEFCVRALRALGYEEHVDFDVLEAAPDSSVNTSNAPMASGKRRDNAYRIVQRIVVHREHRQTIAYVQPCDAVRVTHVAELMCIDEAAAIPLPLVRRLFGPYLVLLSSTINGYEGTGRSLSLKLLAQLRQQAAAALTQTTVATNLPAGTPRCRVLHEMRLTEPIRYAAGDRIEAWLNELLCLNVSALDDAVDSTKAKEERKRKLALAPVHDCELFYVDRDALFAYHRLSETFLKRLVAIYVSSHYKNSPNDLQLLADAPAHHLFVLIPRGSMRRRATDAESNADADADVPEILAVIQVCLEGEVSRETVADGLARGRRAAGDLIPWTIAQQFAEDGFAHLSGARLVRIATHPDYQRLGYGSYALRLLIDYYRRGLALAPSAPPADTARNVQKPLLVRLDERAAERLDYVGVSYGLTLDLLRFWKKARFAPVYLRQTPNELTGENTCIMLRRLDQSEDQEPEETDWLLEYFIDFRRRFFSLLSFTEFSQLRTTLALELVSNSCLARASRRAVTQTQTAADSITRYDAKRLKMYSNNLVDYHAVVDLVPTLARLYFVDLLPGRVEGAQSDEATSVSMSAVQSAILLGFGAQHKSAEMVSEECNIPISQLLAIFNRIVRKFVTYFDGLARAKFEAQFDRVAAGDKHTGPTDNSRQKNARETEEPQEVEMVEAGGQSATDDRKAKRKHKRKKADSAVVQEEPEAEPEIEAAHFTKRKSNADVKAHLEDTQVDGDVKRKKKKNKKQQLSMNSTM